MNGPLFASTARQSSQHCSVCEVLVSLFSTMEIVNVFIITRLLISGICRCIYMYVGNIVTLEYLWLRFGIAEISCKLHLSVYLEVRAGWGLITWLTWLTVLRGYHRQGLLTYKRYKPSFFLLRADFLSVCVAYNRRNYITIRASKSMFLGFMVFWVFKNLQSGKVQN